MKNTLKFFVLIMVIGLLLTTCDNTNGGEVDKTCSHTWGWIVTTAPTDFGDGEKTEMCSKCKETRGKESVLATGMVQIPAGTFTMGPDVRINEATFNVTLSAFKMSKFTVTQELYEAVMGVNPSNFHGGEGREPAEGEVQGKRPVETVTWFDVIEFCNKLSEREGLEIVYIIEGRTPEAGYPITSATVTVNWEKNGYRLPTDAQWEYACRAGSTTDWHFGDDESQLVNYAWYVANNSGTGTRQVGKKLPNAFGLYDMHGNVNEWCWDWWGDYPTEAKTDYTGWFDGADRVIRGGNFLVPASNTRSASRYNTNPDNKFFGIGFRVARP